MWKVVGVPSGFFEAAVLKGLATHFRVIRAFGFLMLQTLHVYLEERLFDLRMVLCITCSM